jgi:hypothetical protein
MIQTLRSRCAFGWRCGVISGLAVTVFLATAPSSQATSINFDDLPAAPDSLPGSAVPANARLTNQYASQGVLFSSLGGFASIVNLGAGTPSSPNAIGGSFSDETISYSVPIELTFVLPGDPALPAVTDFVSIRGTRSSQRSAPIR